MGIGKDWQNGPYAQTGSFAVAVTVIAFISLDMHLSFSEALVYAQLLHERTLTMPRQSMSVGDYGRISFSTLENGQVQALCRVRDDDGETRRVKARGSNQARAEAALKAKIKARVKGESEDITAETKVRVLAESWFNSLDRAPGTQDIYRHTLDRHILPGLGNLVIREVTTGRLDRFLTAVATPTPRKVQIRSVVKEVMVGGPTSAKMCRTVLSGMMRLAVSHGAARYNPVREVAPAPLPTRSENRALTVDELNKLRQRVRDWQAGHHRGPTRTQDIGDMIDAFIATGVRPGELLALRWEDIDLKSDVPTVTITGTVRRSRDKGLVRQPHPKTEAGKRELKLPPFAVSMFRRRKLAQEPNPMGLVFASRTGGLIEPNNFNRRWKEIRGEEFSWVTGKSFRKAVATIIRDESGLTEAAAQLGHASEEHTRRYYAERGKSGPDMRDALERFGGAAGN